MKDHIVLVTVVKLLIPFILLYGLYVQFHGEYSPGGGFQAGVIVASAFIAYFLIFGSTQTHKVISLDGLRILACIGVSLYLGTGIVCMMLGGAFLNYSVLLPSDAAGQHLGIAVIELGVGITVFSVMLMLFSLFASRRPS